VRPPSTPRPDNTPDLVSHDILSTPSLLRGRPLSTGAAQRPAQWRYIVIRRSATPQWVPITSPPSVRQLVGQIERRLRVEHDGRKSVLILPTRLVVACWSLDLLGTSGIMRVVGAWGCLVGIVPVLALPLGWIHLDVHGMAQVVALHASWYVAVAFILGSFMRTPTRAPV